MENTARLSQVDPEIARLVREETERQEEGLELIASENFVSPAVLEALGSTLTNKYAEGYPGKRYYGGCEVVDKVEELAISRAKQLFGADHVNVQAHSGSQANMAAYMAMMDVGDTLLSLDLNSGGHLTHGSSVNFSGRLYKVVHYGLSEKTETIDFDQVHRLAKEHRPKVIVVGASAYPRTLDFARFREIADEVNAAVMVDMAHIAGLVAAGEHPNPVPHADFVTTTTHKTLRGPRGGMVMCREPYAKAVNSRIFPGIQGGPLMHAVAAKAVAFQEALKPEFKAYQHQIVLNAKALAQSLQSAGLRLTSGGTDNHLMMVDLRSKKLTGKVAEEVLGKAGITVNKNMIPFDPEKPMVTSGIRVGTPALTTRGMKESEMAKVGQLIGEALDHAQDDTALTRIKGQVKELTQQFPLYASRLKGQSRMRCPFCRDPENKVIDSRESQEGSVIRRRRECLACERRFTTYERVEELLPLIVKKDGRREAYDRDKLISGLKKAVEKRPVSSEQVEHLVDEVERKLQGLGEKEVPSSMLGTEVMKRLQELDEVAYVRFASVYRSFRDISEFMTELKELIEERSPAVRPRKPGRPKEPDAE